MHRTAVLILASVLIFAAVISVPVLRGRGLSQGRAAGVAVALLILGAVIGLAWAVG